MAAEIPNSPQRDSRSFQKVAAAFLAREGLPFAEMVRRELWTTILGYNLIRAMAVGAALPHGKQPRQISFTATYQEEFKSICEVFLVPIDERYVWD